MQKYKEEMRREFNPSNKSYSLAWRTYLLNVYILFIYISYQSCIILGDE